MLRSTTSSRVRSDAASAGRAAFLFPAGTIVPARGVPPSMMNFSMRDRPGSGAGEDTLPCAWRRAWQPPTRDEAWELVCEWTQSDSLRKHMLGVEAAMRAYAREFGEDEELYGVTGLLHDLDYERYPDLDDRAPAQGARAVRGEGLPRRS